MDIVCVDPRTDPLWEQVVGQFGGSVFHSPGWISVLTDTYDMEILAYIILDDAHRPQGGIPFSRIADIMGRRIVTLPFSDYCDPLVDDGDLWACLIDQLCTERCCIVVRCLHNDLPLADSRFAVHKRARWHSIDLQPDLDMIWNCFAGAGRRAIKKSEQDGVAVRAAQSKADLRAFYEMHLGVRKHKYHLVAQPYCFFENIWRRFIERGCGALLLAVHGAEVIGGVMFLEWDNTLYYKFNASNPAHLCLRPNDALVWRGIQYAKDKGYTRLDFGLSDWDQEGLLRFKRKFASEEKTISFLRYAPDGWPSPQEQQFRSLLPQLTGLFTDESVPDGVTEKAGEILYRFFV